LRCYVAERGNTILENSTATIKDLEMMRKACWQGMRQTPAPLPSSIVDRRNNLNPTAYNEQWREWVISVAKDYFNQNDPPSVEHINNDWTMACEMLVAARGIIGPFAGWDMHLEQVNWLCDDETHHVSPNAIMKVDDLDIYTVSDSTHTMTGAGKSGKKRDIKEELKQCVTEGSCEVVAYSGATADMLIDRIIEAGNLMTKKNDGRQPLAGTVLHVAWNLNEVFKDKKLILGDYDDIMKMGMKLFLDGLDLGETAKRWFPRAVFVAGGTSTNWKTSNKYDWYASSAQLGVMIAGHIVYSGEYLYASLAEQKKPDDPWHFLKKDPWDKASPANAIVRDIARDCLMAQKVQSGAHFYDQHECTTSLG
jgi:hypothetical protein